MSVPDLMDRHLRLILRTSSPLIRNGPLNHPAEDLDPKSRLGALRETAPDGPTRKSMTSYLLTHRGLC